MTHGNGKSINRHQRDPKSRSGPWEPDEADLLLYADHCTGKFTRSALAEKHRTSRRTVYTRLKQVGAWFFTQNYERVEHIKAEHVERLEEIAVEARLAWDRSKQAEEAVTLTTGGKDGDRMTETSKGQCGDPRFLAEYRSALKDIREITGANAPLEIKHSGELRIAGLSRGEARLQKALEIVGRLPISEDERSNLIDRLNTPSEN